MTPTHDVAKTKFYPVDLTGRVIYDDPHKREGDLAWKYRGLGFTAIRGARLMEHRCYYNYSWREGMK